MALCPLFLCILGSVPCPDPEIGWRAGRAGRAAHDKERDALRRKRDDEAGAGDRDMRQTHDGVGRRELPRLHGAVVREVRQRSSRACRPTGTSRSPSPTARDRSNAGPRTRQPRPGSVRWLTRSSRRTWTGCRRSCDTTSWPCTSACCWRAWSSVRPCPVLRGRRSRRCRPARSRRRCGSPRPSCIP